MNWQEYAAQLEAEIKGLEEIITKLRQEVRSFQRQLIGAGSQNDTAEQLEKAKQEAARDKQAYIGHLNRLQQRLNIHTGQNVTANRSVASNKEVESIQAENQWLKAMLSEVTNPPAHLQQQATSKKQTAATNASENARLQNLSDRENSDKRSPFDDTEDDEEPAGPSPSTKIKDEPKSTPRNSIPLAPAPEDANDTRGTQSAAAKNHAELSKPGRRSQPPAITRETARPTAPAASGPRVVSRPTSSAMPSSESRNATTTIDLTEADHAAVPVVRSNIPAGNGRLPVRTSLHDNITVADQSPQPTGPEPKAAKSAAKTIVPPSTTKKVAPPSGRVPASTRPLSAKSVAITAAADLPATKRKRGIQEVPTDTRAKRRRSKEEEIRDEVADLTISACGFDEPPTPRSRRRESYEESDADSDSESDDAFEASMDFRFIAVCSYNEQDEVADHFPSEELADCVAALWERISDVKAVWEGAAGADWQWDFEKRKRGPPVCVTQKVQKKATEWGAGTSAGKYACAGCVRAGKPCFTHVPGKRGGFRLLPLRAKDRVAAVTEGKETRYWP